MVRFYIRNGVCGVEAFFKTVSTESKVAVLLAAYRANSATFQEFRETVGGEMDDSVLAKRLSEFVASGFMDKLVCNSASGSRTTYRVTQKALDIYPAFEMMHTFCRQWLHTETEDPFEWVAYTRKLLGSRWNARIIWLLFVLRAMRFNELKNSIEGISFKMLTQQLRYLEGEAVVLRTDYQENPPHTEYSLTAKGESLYQILLLVSSWNAKYTQKKERNGKPCELNLSI